MVPCLGHPWLLGEALPAFGAGWAAKEGLAPLHDYLQRWCGQPGHTLIENGNLSLATTLWYDQPQPTTHGNCDEFEGAVVATRQMATARSR